MDSTPALRFSQNSSRLFAPGTLTAIPITAMPSIEWVISGLPINCNLAFHKLPLTFVLSLRTLAEILVRRFVLLTLAQVVGKGVYRWILEHLRHGERTIESLLQSVMNAHNHQRMSAEFEEVIMNSNLLDAEQFLPDFSDGSFQLRAGSDVSVWQLRSGVLCRRGLSWTNAARRRGCFLGGVCSFNQCVEVL